MDQMDHHEYFEADQQNMTPRYRQPQKPNALATGAMTCGIFALLSVCTCLLPLTFILVPSSIILALLSKGSDAKMHTSARIGVISSISGFSLFLIMIVSVLALFFSSPEYRRLMLNMADQASEAAYGMDFEETMQQLYGEDFDIYEFFMLEPEDGAEGNENGTMPEDGTEGNENGAAPEGALRKMS